MGRGLDYRCYGRSVRPVWDEIDYSAVDIVLDGVTEFDNTSATISGQLTVSGNAPANAVIEVLYSMTGTTLEELKTDSVVTAELTGRFFRARLTELQSTTYHYTVKVQIGNRIYYGPVKSFCTDSQATGNSLEGFGKGAPIGGGIFDGIKPNNQ